MLTRAQLLLAALATARGQDETHHVLYGCPECGSLGTGAPVESEAVIAQYGGLQRLEAEGKIKLTTRALTDAASMRAAINDVAPDQIITTGDEIDCVGEVAPEFPTKMFSVIDAPSGCNGDPANVQVVVFKQEQMGYLAGKMAGLHSQTGRVAMLAGTATRDVKRLRNGFHAGVRASCENCVVDGLHATSTDDEALGVRMSSEFVARGADVVFGAAGATGSAGIKHVAGPTWVIGAEEEEYRTTFAGEHDKAPFLLGSAMKMMDAAATACVNDVLAGEFQPGWRELDLGDGALGMSPCHDACPSMAEKTLRELGLSVVGMTNGEIDIKLTAEGHHTFACCPREALGRYPMSHHYGEEQTFAWPKYVNVDPMHYLVLDGGAASWNESVWYADAFYALDHHYVASVEHPEVRMDFALAGAGGAGYLFGGRQEAEPMGDMWKWQPSCPECSVDPTWARVATATAPAARSGHSMTTVGTRLYMFGGKDKNGALLNDLWVFDTVTQSWAEEKAAGAPRERELHGAVLWETPNGKPIVKGGVNDTSFLVVAGGLNMKQMNDLWVFGLNARQWGALVPKTEAMPKGRYNACVAAVGWHIMFMYGQCPKKNWSDKWAYSMFHDVWTVVPCFGEFGGPHSCHVVPGTVVDVLDEGLPAYANKPHRMMMAAIGSSRTPYKLSPFFEHTFPAISCNETVNLVLSPSGLRCDVCPNGTAVVEGVCKGCLLFTDAEWDADARVQGFCPRTPPAPPVGLIVGVVFAVLVLVGVPVAWHSSKSYRKMRKLLNTNKVATELAVSVSLMDFEAVAYLDTIAHPTKIQGAFIQIVKALKEMKAYMPQALFADESEVEECDESQAATKSKREWQSESSRSSGKTRGTGTTQSKSNTVTLSRRAQRLAAQEKKTQLTLTKKKLAMVLCNVKAFHDLMGYLSDTALISQHARIVSLVLSAFASANGVADTFCGDRFVCTFNAVRVCQGFRQAACRAAEEVRDMMKQSMPEVDMSIAIATGPGRVGNCGNDVMRRFTFLTPVYSWVAVLERIAANEGVAILADSYTTCENTGYETRAYAQVLYKKRGEAPIEVSEVVRAAPAAAEEEWMYQLEEAEKNDPNAAWNEFAGHVFAGRCAQVTEMATNKMVCAALEGPGWESRFRDVMANLPYKPIEVERYASLLA